MTKNSTGKRIRSTRKLSISITMELDKALEAMCARTGVNKSRSIENMLRNNRLISQYIETLNAEKSLEQHKGPSAARPVVDSMVATPVFNVSRPVERENIRMGKHSVPEGEKASESSGGTAGA